MSVPADGYLAVWELQQAIGGTRTTREDDYVRAILAASREIDRWTGRRFLLDADPSTRYFPADEPHRVLVGDFVDPDDVLVESDDAGDGTWTVWDADEWHAEGDDIGNGRFVRLDGEPWRWIATSSTRRFPARTRWSGSGWYGSNWYGSGNCSTTGANVARVRATAHWGWDTIPVPVSQACLSLAVLYFQAKDRSQQMLVGDPVMEAKTLVKDYAVEGGTILCRPLVG